MRRVLTVLAITVGVTRGSCAQQLPTLGCRNAPSPQSPKVRIDGTPLARSAGVVVRIERAASDGDTRLVATARPSNLSATCRGGRQIVLTIAGDWRPSDTLTVVVAGTESIEFVSAVTGRIAAATRLSAERVAVTCDVLRGQSDVEVSCSN